jgi:plasmid segregation protein ParM
LTNRSSGTLPCSETSVARGAAAPQRLVEEQVIRLGDPVAEQGEKAQALEAMSVLLEKAAAQIAQEHGGRRQPLALEAALRQGRSHLLVTGRRTPLRPVMEPGAREVSSLALEALRQSLRREMTNVDLVLLTGSGGELYGQKAAPLFPGADVRLAPEPVIANARGFFRYGQR